MKKLLKQSKPPKPISMRLVVAAMVEECLQNAKLRAHRYSKGGMVFFNVTPNLNKSAKAVLGFTVQVGDNVEIYTNLGQWHQERTRLDIASPHIQEELTAAISRYDFIEDMCSVENQSVRMRRLRGAILLLADNEPVGFLSYTKGNLRITDMSGQNLLK